eukprot:scaffold117944_cov37-Prasinocladus_malaysianus.AAC.2
MAGYQEQGHTRPYNDSHISLNNQATETKGYVLARIVQQQPKKTSGTARRIPKHWAFVLGSLARASIQAASNNDDNRLFVTTAAT